MLRTQCVKRHGGGLRCARDAEYVYDQDANRERYIYCREHYEGLLNRYPAGYFKPYLPQVVRPEKVSSG